MDKINIAWAAGLFEGEGSISKHGGIGAKGYKLEVCMTDEDVIQRLYKVFNVGVVYGPYTIKSFKPKFRWIVNDAKSVNQVLEAILPYAGDRRRDKMTVAIEANKQIKGRIRHKPIN